MTVATVPTVGAYPTRLSNREAKVVEAAVAASATSDASATMTLTNKTIDGDLNTIQDLAVTCLKTAAGNADKVVMGTSTTGVPKFDKIVPANIATDVANADKVLMGTTATGVPKFDKVGLLNLATGIAPAYIIAVVGTGVTGSTVIGVKTGDICLKIDTVGGGAGLVTWALAVANNTVPQTLAPGDLAVILRSAA